MSDVQPLLNTGAYEIRNTVNGKVYVGGAYRSFTGREKLHWRTLRKGRHANRHLQAAWNKYGEEAFVFEVLERCPPEQVEEVEQKWLDIRRATDPDRGYNICPVARSSSGVKRTEETKAKLSQSRKGKVPWSKGKKGLWVSPRKGKKMSAEFCARNAAAHLGKKASAETRAKMSQARKGRKHTAESRAKIVASWKQVVLSPEERARRSTQAAERNRNREWTEEDRRDVAERMKGNVFGSLLRGECNGRAKLTEEQVRTIRREYSGFGVAHLARMFGVAETTMRDILTRKKWKHVV